MKREVRPLKNLEKGIENDILGYVCEDPYEICENTMETSRLSKGKKAEYGISSAFCDDGTPFDLGPSGGANSPNTEVNAENQGVSSEVPRKPNFMPDENQTNSV